MTALKRTAEEVLPQAKAAKGTQVVYNDNEDDDGSDGGSSEVSEDEGAYSEVVGVCETCQAAHMGSCWMEPEWEQEDGLPCPNCKQRMTLERSTCVFCNHDQTHSADNMLVEEFLLNDDQVNSCTRETCIECGRKGVLVIEASCLDCDDEDE